MDDQGKGPECDSCDGTGVATWIIEDGSFEDGACDCPSGEALAIRIEQDAFTGQEPNLPGEDGPL